MLGKMSCSKKLMAIALAMSVGLVVPAELASAQAAPAGTPPNTPSFKVDVEVVATMPLPGVELTLDQIPAPVQRLNSRDLEDSGALDISDFLNRRLNGVHVNDVQGNPFQQDLSYRGYTASPLLGTPQGLSVYMDGVRLNQPFGEIVSWDLIPRMAIASGVLVPGSNPLFGLNTLGGALSLQTKNGRGHKGGSVQALYGSHLRRTVEFEHGGEKAGGLNWYVAGSLFGENGWRQDSPSDVGQIFGKLGWQQAKTDLSLTVAHANNTLTGNGLQEQRFLGRDYTSVYTKPDITDNRSTFLNMGLRRSHSERLTFSGNLYYRHMRTGALNGDINEGSLDQSVYQPSPAERRALLAAGYTNVPSSGASADNTPFPFLRCIGNVLLKDAPGEKCNGLINRTHTAQNNSGFSGQATWLQSSGTRRNQFAAGAAYDRSGVGFVQSTELGYLNPDRSVTGTGAFADGVSAGTVDGEPFDARIDLDGRLHTSSVFATDTLSIGNAWHLTLSGRYNQTAIHNRDAIAAAGAPGTLDGDHAFRRLNPAAGVTFSPSQGLNIYAGYSEGSRAATSIELGCANPEEPCKLPNAMAGDPPLAQVVTRTIESGVRGGLEAGTSWNIGAFRAENSNDILFVASSQTGFGYFTNFGETRRQGLELGLSTHIRQQVVLGAGYTWIDATFQSAETMNGSGNSTNGEAEAGARGLDGTINVKPGNRLPFVPRQMVKLYADMHATRKLSVNVGLVGVSSSFARGNENNQHEADGTYYFGPGESPGHAVVSLGGRYQLKARLELFAQADNLFNRRYYTAAQLGSNGFTDTGAFIARPLPLVNGEFPVRQSTFFAPGAPRAVFAGVRLRF